MTLHRATYLDTGCQVIRSDDGGIHWQPVGPVHTTGKAARALIASIEGELVPLRSGPDSLPTLSGTAEAAPAGQDKTAE